MSDVDVTFGNPVSQAMLSSFQNSMLKSGTDLVVSAIMVPLIAKVIIGADVSLRGSYTANYLKSTTTWDGIQSRFGSNFLFLTAFLAFGYFVVRK